MSNKVNLEEYLAMSWHFSVEPTEWEGKKGFWAWVCEMPNCSTFGTTRSDALSTVVQLLPAYLKAALESNADVPVPESRQPDADIAGGTIVLRMPKSLHIGLKHAAATDNTSLNQFAVYALTKAVCQTNTPLSTRTAKAIRGKKSPAAKK